MPLTPGTNVGQYEIIEPLGAGSMGEVYRARDKELNRDVAIKVLPELRTTDRSRQIRFEQEARAAAALNHPNIVTVYQMGTYAGVPYLVTELLEGKTLTETIRRGPLSIRRTIDYGFQIAQGLAAAHEKGIVHRDLKPDNLFVTKENRIKILDFGLAKFVDSEKWPAPASTITLPGVAMGTVGYMAPEQVRGLAVDHRADIFALGAILFEMVMGKRTFERPTSADTMSAILNEEAPHISDLSTDVPIALERIVRRCLEKNPDQRFQSASDLAFALQALSDPSVSAPSGANSAMQVPSRRISPAQVAGAVILVACAAALTYLWTRPEPVPKISNYLQLTHDGQQKSLIGSDGSRLYLSLGEAREGSFVSRGLAEMSATGSEPRKLNILPSPNMAPVDLSPGGSELLAVDGQGAPPKGSLWSIPLIGGSPRRIGDLVAETAAWSPDRKALAYSVLGDLFLAGVDGSGAHKILSVPGDILNMTWSPDGAHLRFDSSVTAGTVGQQVIWETSLKGSDLHRLLPGWHDPPDECCGKWTADGKYFVFRSKNQIWALAASRGIFHSHDVPVQLTSSPMSLNSPLPSRDGSKLFVVGQTYRGELSRYDAKTSRFLPFLGSVSGEFASFSSDGQWVAYVSYPAGMLWRSRVDGTDKVQLTDPPMYPLLPRWSPDGKKIVFFEFATASDKPARMYEVSVDGGSPRLILPEDHSQQLDPNWSPDGSKIIFGGESNDPSSTIRILDVASHQLAVLPGSQGLYSPRWSPDNKHIAAFSADSGKLMLFDLQTQKWSELTSGSLSWLTWLHDGQYLYFLDLRGKAAVERIRVASGRTEPVADLKDFQATGRYGASLSLAPDDSPLLLRDTGTQDVYSVDWEPGN
jgi:serine/threonine protein kinase/Tol biopolymer transport system component